MNPAALLTVTAAGAMLAWGARRTEASSVEAGQGDPFGTFTFEALTDRAENLVNVITETPADVPTDTAAGNVGAFLAVLRRAEGTEGRGDPYRVCYGYRHTIGNLAEHPAVSGEWSGEKLPDGMCIRAGFGPGCVSTAAGAYQLIKPTWKRVRDRLQLQDFGPQSQDAAAVELIRSRGALEDVRAGRFAAAVDKVRNEWASLPGNYAGQGQRSTDTLAAWYAGAGGTFA